MPASPAHLVFVYGSLKRGFHNHPILYRGGALYQGPAITVSPYLMLSGSMFPFLLNPAAFIRKTSVEGIIGRTKGELYIVREPLLARLDALEGHPDFYRREQVMIKADRGSVIVAWVYFLQTDPADIAAPIVKPDADGFVEWTQEHVTPYESHDELADDASEGEE